MEWIASSLRFSQWRFFASSARKRRRPLGHLLLREEPCLAAAQQEKELRRLLELLDRIGGGVERGAGDDGTVIGEEHGVMLAGEAAHRLGERHVAGSMIGHERQAAGAHPRIG